MNVIILILTALSAISCYQSKQRSFLDSHLLYFLYDDKLVQVNVSDAKYEEKIFIDSENVKDYCLDPIRDRVFWIDYRNELFIRNIFNETTKDVRVDDKFMLDLSGSVETKMAYNEITDELYIVESRETSLIVRVIDFKSFGIKVVYQESLSTRDHKVLKVVLDPKAHILFVLHEVDGAKNIFRLNMKSYVAKISISDASTYSDFDVDYKNKKLYATTYPYIKAMDYNCDSEKDTLFDKNLTAFGIHANKMFQLGFSTNKQLFVQSQDFQLDSNGQLELIGKGSCSFNLGFNDSNLFVPYSLRVLRKSGPTKLSNPCLPCHVDSYQLCSEKISGTDDLMMNPRLKRRKRQFGGIIMGLSHMKGRGGNKRSKIRRRNNRQQG